MGEALWVPADYDHLAQRLLAVLTDGLAAGDNRFRRVMADGSPWMVRPLPNTFKGLDSKDTWPLVVTQVTGV
jgi:hypothetical protein